jgi:hypothetical protein
MHVNREIDVRPFLFTSPYLRVSSGPTFRRINETRAFLPLTKRTVMYLDAQRRHRTQVDILTAGLIRIGGCTCDPRSEIPDHRDVVFVSKAGLGKREQIKPFYVGPTLKQAMEQVEPVHVNHGTQFSIP